MRRKWLPLRRKTRWRRPRRQLGKVERRKLARKEKAGKKRPLARRDGRLTAMKKEAIKEKLGKARAAKGRTPRTPRKEERCMRRREVKRRRG